MIHTIAALCYCNRWLTKMYSSHSCIRLQWKQQQAIVRHSHWNTNGESLELTLAIIKPHICKDPFALEAIRQIILDNGFYFIRSTQMQMSIEQAEQFYQEHQGKFFFDRLVSFMTSGEIAVHCLARHFAITQWRKLMGPTKVFRTKIEQPQSIRGQFGVSDTRNATHGSDSPESAVKEIAFFFPHFDVPLWFSTEEHLFRNAAILANNIRQQQQESKTDKEEYQIQVEFDRKCWLHHIVKTQFNNR